MKEYVIDDIENINRKFDEIIHRKLDSDIPTDLVALESYMDLFHAIVAAKGSSIIPTLKIKHQKHHKNSYLLKIAHVLRNDGKMTPDMFEMIHDRLRIKRGKSHSGVLVITVFTSPYPSYTNENGEWMTQKFSCQWNCYYCPNEPGQPRSYLKGEPGVLRANQFEFDACNQMWDRMTTLLNIGHPVDKLEIIVLGGTWASYPRAYQECFIRDLYYSANTFFEKAGERRPKESLAFERDRNRYSDCKVIGLTLETRPDTISVDEIIEFRRFGCTRIQLGIQHIENDILKKINRKCTYAQIVDAIRLLKDWGYKVDGHFMPNLPGSTYAIDRRMIMDELLGQRASKQEVEPKVHGVDVWERWMVTNDDLQIDQWKVYPCEVVPWTVIEKWYKEGSFIPYEETDLTNLLLEMKRNMFPWIRLNRIVRDIPSDYILASSDVPNLRQNLQTAMKASGHTCPCIRCREVKLNTYEGSPKWIVREYKGSGGDEFFVSAEAMDCASQRVLLGFVRLRISNQQAWVRELHVYGKIIPTYEHNDNPNLSSSGIQHQGIGKKLMQLAENITVHHSNISMIKVIAGEGTKVYYEKLGYHEGLYGYMEKVMH